MTMEIKVGDKVRVREDAPKMYVGDFAKAQCSAYDCIVAEVEGDNALIQWLGITLPIPAKYLVKVEEEEKEAKFDLGDKVTLNGHGGFVINAYYLNPYTQEYKYRLGGFKGHFCESDLEPYTEPSNEESAVLRADSVKESRITDEESHLRNLSQETANCDKQFDKILRMNTEAERRQIAAQVMCAMISNDYYAKNLLHSQIAELAVECADALIAELDKKKD